MATAPTGTEPVVSVGSVSRSPGARSCPIPAGGPGLRTLELLLGHWDPQGWSVMGQTQASPERLEQACAEPARSDQELLRLAGEDARKLRHFIHL